MKKFQYLGHSYSVVWDNSANIPVFVAFGTIDNEFLVEHSVDESKCISKMEKAIFEKLAPQE
jgi:hypothetical protein